MYKIKRSQRFKKSYKKVSKLKGFKRDIFVFVLNELRLGHSLDRKFKDHALAGDMRDYRECHLAVDMLLIYEVDDDILTLTLVNIGSHSKTF